MDELIDKILETLSWYDDLKKEKCQIPNIEDISDMIFTVEELLKLKDKEISAFHRLFCASAHSFKQSQTPVLLDAACEQAKKEYRALENLRKSLKNIKSIDNV